MPSTREFATTQLLTTQALTTQPTTLASTTRQSPPVQALNGFLIGDDIVPIDPTELPSIGSPDAPHRVAVFSDYTCPYCRAFHPWLFDASKRYGNQLVIILLPMAMDAKYVPRLGKTPPEHVNSYALAKIAMAVWQADRTKFFKMDEWLFEGRARTPEAAHDFAAQLVGAEALKKAEADPAVERNVRRDIRLYVESGGGNIPKMLLTKGASMGKLTSEKAFFQYLEKELDIKPVPGSAK